MHGFLCHKNFNDPYSIHSFTSYFLNTCHVFLIILTTEDKQRTKKIKILALMVYMTVKLGVYFLSM